MSQYPGKYLTEPFNTEASESTANLTVSTVKPGLTVLTTRRAFNSQTKR